MAQAPSQIALVLLAPIVVAAKSDVQIKFDKTPIINLNDIEDDFVRQLVCALPLLIVGIFSLIFVVILRFRLKSKKVGKDIGKPKLDYLADKVKSGSTAFLKEEY